MSSTSRAIPEADVLKHRRADAGGTRVTIRCPYCTRTHEHSIGRRGRQRFAPACGLTLNPEDRARGYSFTF